MINVQSDNVHSYEYESTTGVLTVLFRSGGLYEYSGISENLASWFKAPHPWRHIGKLVMSHPVRKLN